MIIISPRATVYMKSRWRRYVKVNWQYSKCRPTLIEIHMPRRILPSRSGRSTTWTRDVAARNNPVLWRQVCVVHHQDHPKPKPPSSWYLRTRQLCRWQLWNPVTGKAWRLLKPRWIVAPGNELRHRASPKLCNAYYRAVLRRHPVRTQPGNRLFSLKFRGHCSRIFEE
jgi:hypothetical protein